MSFRHAAELEAENTALANSLVARMAKPQPAAADCPAEGADKDVARAATAMRKSATGSQSGTLAELPALTNAGATAAAPSAGAQSPAARQAMASADVIKKHSRGQKTPAIPADTAEELAADVPAKPKVKAGRDGDHNKDDGQPKHDDVSSPCASTAGKRQWPIGAQKTARKAARREGSSSPKQRRKQPEAEAAAGADTAEEAGKQREQKRRILDLSHLSSFACTAKGALDKLRGGGPRRRTADVTLMTRAVRAALSIHALQSFGPLSHSNAPTAAHACPTEPLPRNAIHRCCMFVNYLPLWHVQESKMRTLAACRCRLGRSGLQQPDCCLVPALVKATAWAQPPAPSGRRHETETMSPMKTARDAWVTSTAMTVPRVMWCPRTRDQ